MTRIPIACSVCGYLHATEMLSSGMMATCVRCGGVVKRNPKNSLRRTAAFSLAALLLYVPANIYPILHLELHGVSSENTMWSSCVKLFEDGQLAVAVIVFLASIVIPFCKLLGLFFLTITAYNNSTTFTRGRVLIYQIISIAGPWAMLDVFIVAILIALVRLGRFATVLPGSGLLVFTAMVVLSILASESFDPSLIWRGITQIPHRYE